MGFEEVQAGSEDGIHLLLDARDRNLYEAGHIPNAISIPYEFATRKSLNGLLKQLTEDFTKPTIIYCGDKFCPKAYNLTKQLSGLGHAEAYLYADGFSDWEANGGTVKTAAGTPTSPTPTTPQDTTEPPTGTDAGTAQQGVAAAPSGTSGTKAAVGPRRTSNKVVPAEAIQTAFSGKNHYELAKFIVPWVFIALGLLSLFLPIPAFTWLLRICIGGLFIYSGLQKMVFPDAFAQNVACYLMVPAKYVNMIAFVLPPLEVIAGAVLIFIPYLRQAAALLIFGMLVMFIGATGMALWQGLEIDCGCTSNSKPLEWSKIAKNTIYALGCLALLFYLPRRWDHQDHGASDRRRMA